MKRIRNCSLLLICFLPSLSFAQDKLTLEQAMDAALKSNYDISIAKNEAEIASNNNTLGNAGMLPKVDLQASTSLANNATKQEFSNGLVVDKNGVQSQNITSGVYLTWTLFDGMKMFATHQKLGELEAMGEMAAKIRIENTVAGVITAYYDVVRQKQLITGLEENIKISEERLKIAEKRMEIGSGSKLDVLQAKTDKNAQTSNLFRQRTQLAELKMQLNTLMERSPEMEFDVADDIPLGADVKYEELKNEMTKSNLDLLYAQRNVNLAGQVLKESRSTLFPKLNFNANYLFTRAENQAGFTLLNQNLGLNLGLTASWTIFNGMNNRSQVKNAQLEVMNADLGFKSLELEVQHQLLSAYKKHLDDSEILKLEEENTKLAKEAVDIALERFRIGSSNSVELKEVQNSYDDALSRLAEARFNAKVSETQLMKLNGKLVK
ncbi:MAG: TolC family protein [Bacteroidia bacterium]